jgi:hypothetical protein
MTEESEDTIWDFKDSEWETTLEGLENILNDPLSEVIAELKRISDSLGETPNMRDKLAISKIQRVIGLLDLIKKKYKFL